MPQFLLSSSSSYCSSCTMSSAKSFDDNCTIIPMVHFIFPECPELAALLSLASVVTKQRQSVFIIQHPICLPVLLTLQNVHFKFVNLASQQCIGTFRSPTTSQSFTFQSLCFNLPAHSTCQEAEASQQSVLNRNISSSDYIFAEFTQSNLGGNHFIHFTCCYGENCTEHNLLYAYSIPTPIVTESVVAMDTGSVLVTPTVSF